jgi:uroporphyrinogen-III synthase
MWILLRDRKLRGLKFRRQFPVASFVLDFCCYELRMAVELDGEVHSSGHQARHDQNRDAFLKSLGYLVLRFPQCLDPRGA